MIVLDVVCRARSHDTDAARRAGCTCPVGWATPFRPKPRTWNPESYVRGRRSNMRGPHRSTVSEPDEIAVERFVSGDRPAVLAKVERDAAIDYLDRYGYSGRQIAVRLGMTMRAVQRRRAERRREAMEVPQ